MEKAQKYIYESIVKKQIEEPSVEKRIENGEEISVTKTIKKVKPVKIAILRPDRKKYKEAEIFYAKRLSAYLKEGIMPHALVTKRYINDGGPLSEEEKTFLQTLRNSYVTLQTEYFEMKSPLTEAQNARRGEIILELNEINKNIQEIQSNYAEIFSNTAEAKSKVDLIEWWIVNIGLIDGDDKGYKPVFGEGDFEAKMNKLDELEAQQDAFISEVISKISYFISFWHTAGLEISEDDFKSAESNYAENVTKYVVEETIEKEGFIPTVPGPDSLLLTKPA